ncbi:DUF502 domain-containing protein [Candidatus Omnitrophota bacterium]
MLKRIKNNFLTGLVVLLPVVLTVTIFTFLVKQINTKVLSPMLNFFSLHFYNPYWTYAAKGLAFLLAIFLIIVVGSATKLILLRNFFSFWERLLFKVPTIGKIYSTIKQISRALFGQGKHVFEQVVLIEYPRKGIYSLGFVTSSACAEVKNTTGLDAVYVFIPTTPNPTNGFFLVVPKDEVLPLELSVADAFKLVVSGGTFTPPAD